MTDKERILLVGQNPDTFSGNGNMLGAMAEEVDQEKYELCAFIKDLPEVDETRDPFNPITTLPCPYILADGNSQDPWGVEKLLRTIYNTKLDQLVFVGLDIWRYAHAFDQILELKKQKSFTWKVLVPYDLGEVRKDWLNWLNYPDQTYVYSVHGYYLLQNHKPDIKYFRPRLRFSDLYQVSEEKDKQILRSRIFPDVNEETEIFMYVGANQVRKNIYNMIKGFEKANAKNSILFIHTNNTNQVISIDRVKRDLGIPEGKVRHNNNSRTIHPDEMAAMYQTADCHLLTSLQEGLSWTVVESKLSGLPSVLSLSTAHIDFQSQFNLSPKPITFVKPDQNQLIPLISDQGPCYLEADCCSPEAIRNGVQKHLSYVRKNPDNKAKLQENARKMGEQWLEGCHNFQTDIIEDVPETKESLGEVL